jgi:fumarate reductase (CoM/CoB) subunit A
VSFLPGNNRAWGSQRSWGETPHFLNTRGERFMLRYNPSGAEFGTKEVLVHAIAKEVQEGRGTAKGGVYSDLTHLPWDNPSVRSDMSDLTEHGRRFGFDPKKQPVEMWPVAHTPTGGIPVNERCETSIAGLFAAGSTAGGMYGFGRIEGFTSIITQVYGKRAGEAAVARARSTQVLPLSDDDVAKERDRVLAVLESREGTAPSLIKDRIQSIMYQHAWILRDGPGLTEGLAKILKLRDERISVAPASKVQNLEWVEALEVPNMLTMAELVIRASLLRKESRGSFARVDYPNTDDKEWLVNIVFKKSGSVVTTRTTPGPPLLPASRTGHG